MKNVASCSCGQLSVTYDGEITRTAVCHCFECQKRTGSVFAVQTRLETAKLTIQGKSNTWQRKGEGLATFHFCPICASTLFWENDAMPGSTIVALGNFTNPNLPSPTFMVYGNRMHHWVQMPEGAVEYFG